MEQEPFAFWSISQEELLSRMQTTPEGLSGEEARRRLTRYGPNLIKPKRKTGSAILFLNQFKSPIIIILVIAAIMSIFLGDTTSAVIILVIVLLSGLLGFWQEKGAANAMEKLLTIVKIKTTALRDGKPEEISVEDVVPGDVVLLSAGSTIPGDGVILDSSDLFVDESTLTGETFPVEKQAGITAADASPAQRLNALFMGTHVVSGNVRALVVLTGKATEFGGISERLKVKPRETEFERGIRRFGYFLMEVTLTLVISIFVINVALHRPVLDSFLFSLALAVGLTPQLLPAIISVNLSKGARSMAQSKVIVKQLECIENFGSMDVFCSDKTGTLTEGTVRLHAALDPEGRESEKVLFHAFLNSFYETGFNNPIDEAIRNHRRFDLSGYRKLDEIPYDFVRKRLSICVSRDDREGRDFMVTKGAFREVLEVCSKVETSSGESEDISAAQDKMNGLFAALSNQGYRVLGLAYRELGKQESISKEDEKDMTFQGFINFFDPPKPGAMETIKELEGLGITLKVITGDNVLVASSVCEQVGLECSLPVTGQDLNRMSDEALMRRVNQTNLFAEIEPNQKERIILALRKAGKVVGYMGDGINDAPALHAADVGVSVDSAVDVAKDTAEIVLLEKDLGVLAQGVRDGRTTFANTLKYVFMATSANFGNMFSMAGASLFLPFLPLLPGQVLLTNLLTDFPEMTIATDRVDPELVDKPRRWDIRFILKFMCAFGPLSSVFDYLTFAVLIWGLHASPELFRTGWFLESVVSASLIVLVIRTRKPFYRSRPGKWLTVATLMIVVSTIIIPLTPLAGPMGFQRLPAAFYPALLGILLLYIFFAEVTKRVFYGLVKD
jgi:Mg2+-importing ATPase